jgi:LmbE family N-acetylglucosaminyl deacetylase
VRRAHLGLPDAPLRGIPLTHAALGSANVDDALVAAAVDALRPWCGDAAEVWAPLGAGGHVDHRLAYTAVTALRTSGGPTATTTWRWYEDRPYARAPGVVAARWAALGAVVDDDDEEEEEEEEDVDDDVAFYRVVLPDRLPATPRPTPRRVELHGRRWRRWAHGVDEDVRAVRARALACYASQHGLLWGPASMTCADTNARYGEGRPANDDDARGARPAPWPRGDRAEALWGEETEER